MSSSMMNHRPVLEPWAPPRATAATPAARTAQRSHEWMMRTIPYIRLFPFGRFAGEDHEDFADRRTSGVFRVPLVDVLVQRPGRDLRLVLDVPLLQLRRALHPAADVAVVVVENDDGGRGQPAVRREVRGLDAAALGASDDANLEFLRHGRGELRDVGQRPRGVAAAILRDGKNSATSRQRLRFRE